jgi:hypothetical protein
VGPRAGLYGLEVIKSLSPAVTSMTYDITYDILERWHRDPQHPEQIIARLTSASHKLSSSEHSVYFNDDKLFYSVIKWKTERIKGRLRL